VRHRTSPRFTYRASGDRPPQLEEATCRAFGGWPRLVRLRGARGCPAHATASSPGPATAGGMRRSLWSCRNRPPGTGTSSSRSSRTTRMRSHRRRSTSTSHPCRRWITALIRPSTSSDDDTTWTPKRADESSLCETCGGTTASCSWVRQRMVNDPCDAPLLIPAELRHPKDRLAGLTPSTDQGDSLGPRAMCSCSAMRCWSY
jgi:hypothetical protein